MKAFLETLNLRLFLCVSTFTLSYGVPFGLAILASISTHPSNLFCHVNRLHVLH